MNGVKQTGRKSTRARPVRAPTVTVVGPARVAAAAAHDATRNGTTRTRSRWSRRLRRVSGRSSNRIAATLT